MFGKILSATALAFVVATPAMAAPTLDGKTITVDWLYPDAQTTWASSTFAVGAGVEVSCPGNYQGSGICAGLGSATTIDVQGNSILLAFGPTFFINSAFNGFNFTGLNFGSGYVLEGFELTTTLPGLQPGNITLTTNSIAFNALGLGSLDRGSDFTIQLDLITNSANQVPEPGSLALLGLGLTGLAAVRKRSRG